MSASKSRQRQARARVAAQQAAARRAQSRNRMLLGGGAVVVVLALIGVLIGTKLSQSPASGGGDTAATTDAAVARQVTTVPASTFRAVGTGTSVALKKVNGAALTSGGKPEVLYIGGEYCPYCAAERWALAAALSRFGTLSGVKFIHSSPTDYAPSTPTMTFAHARYASKSLTFTPVEWYSEKPDSSSPTGYAPLQQPTAEQEKLIGRYSGGSFPFVDIGGRYVVSGAQFSPLALRGLTWAQVASDMRDPASAVARDIDGAASRIVAAITKVTGVQPTAGTSSGAA